MKSFFKTPGDDFISVETKMLGHVAKNSGKRAEFEWVVSWNRYMVFAVFSGG